MAPSATPMLASGGDERPAGTAATMTTAGRTTTAGATGPASAATQPLSMYTPLASKEPPSSHGAGGDVGPRIVEYMNISDYSLQTRSAVPIARPIFQVSPIAPIRAPLAPSPRSERPPTTPLPHRAHPSRMPNPSHRASHDRAAVPAGDHVLGICPA